MAARLKKDNKTAESLLWTLHPVIDQQGDKPVYAWLPLAEPEARPLRRAVGALLRELDDTPPDDVTDIPELQVTTQPFGSRTSATAVHMRLHILGEGLGQL